MIEPRFKASSQPPRRYPAPRPRMELPRDYRGLLLVIAGCVLVWGGIAIASFCMGGNG